MLNQDLKHLTYSQLLALGEALDKQIKDKRSEELKVLVDGFAKKLQASGFSVDEAIAVFEPYMRKRGTFKASAPVSVLYRDTANSSNTWSGRGRPARWLADYEAQGRNRDEFKVKG